MDDVAQARNNEALPEEISSRIFAEATVEEPKAAEPKAEAPRAEDPQAEQPKAEEFAVDPLASLAPKGSKREGKAEDDVIPEGRSRGQAIEAKQHQQQEQQQQEAKEAKGAEEPHGQQIGLGKEFSSDPSPFAHLSWSALCAFAAAGLSVKIAHDFYGGVTMRVAEFTDETMITMQLEIQEVIRFVGQIARVGLLTVLLLLSLGLGLRYHVNVKKFFLLCGYNLEGNAGAVNQKLMIKAKEKFAALRPPTLTGEDRARPKLGYRKRSSSSAPSCPAMLGWPEAFPS